MKISTVHVLKELNCAQGKYHVLEGERLKKYQECLLSMVDDVVAVCEKEGVLYELGGGTALGAVRHGGFIPWDDDVDINLLAADYRRFRESFLLTYGDKYTIRDIDAEGQRTAMVKIYLNHSKHKTIYEQERDDLGIDIDIFLIENIYDNPVMRALQGSLCMITGFLFSCRGFWKNRKGYLQIMQNSPQTRGPFMIKMMFGFLVSFLSVDSWARITNACYHMCKNNNSEYVGIPSGSKHYFNEIYRRGGVFSQDENWLRRKGMVYHTGLRRISAEFVWH